MLCKAGTGTRTPSPSRPESRRSSPHPQSTHVATLMLRRPTYREKSPPRVTKYVYAINITLLDFASGPVNSIPYCGHTYNVRISSRGLVAVAVAGT